MKFKNKFLIILLFLILTLFTFTVNSFAFTTNIEGSMTGGNHEFPYFQYGNNYIIFYSTGNKPISPTLWLFPDDYDISNVCTKSGYIYLKNPVTVFKYGLTEDLSNWDLKETKLYYPSSLFSNDVLCHTTFDIYNFDGTELVFQGAPQAKILTQVVEQVEMKAVTQEILGVLLVVLIILVSLIAFWKALSMVRRLLRQS